MSKHKMTGGLQQARHRAALKRGLSKAQRLKNYRLMRKDTSRFLEDEMAALGRPLRVNR
jgi:DNA-binding TFAR19-related protein (PDSD5 family)